MEKFLKFLAIFLLTIIILCSCDSSGFKDYENTTNGRFQKVINQNDLYYDVNTKIVYIVFNEHQGNHGYGYMSPYYADNGLPYKYDVNLCTLIKIEND